jgi:1-acyl-sn-glycerol-3-phosphate acyltransferase
VREKLSMKSKSSVPSSGRQTTLLSRIVRRLIIWVYVWKGWQLEGNLPKDIKKFIIAGAPHTSNWDFVFFTGATHEQGVLPNFMGKHTLFRGIMRDFMFDMGGIPINRTIRANYVEQVAEEFARREELALVIATEGSRSTNGEWKSGFYHIAQAAKVPVVPAYADNDRMILGFGPPLEPSGDYGQDLLQLAKWYRSKLPEEERFKNLEAQAVALINRSKSG